MTIDRGDAVNLVRDLRGYGDNALKKITLNGLWCLFDAIERMDEALRASPPEAPREDWIRIRERQPEDGQFVLAYGDICQGFTDGPKISVFRWHMERWWDANMDAEEVHDDPSHWMPLPDAPGRSEGSK
jgi:hypothetical protein